VDNPAKSKMVRLARVTAGLVMLPVGVALLVLPGPGLPVVASSLMLLDGEFEWASRARGKLTSLARAGATWVQERRDASAQSRVTSAEQSSAASDASAQSRVASTEQPSAASDASQPHC